MELGAGRHLWGNFTSFGECDAALRVKRVVAWRPRQEGRTALSWTLAVLLVLFFYCGGITPQSADPLKAPAGAWSAYVDSARLLQDLRERAGQPKLQIVQAWMEQEGRLVFQDGQGAWYACSFDWQDRKERYHVRNLQPMRQAFLDGYQRVR